MRLRRLLLAVLLALGTTAVALPSAYAGGPTSVLMVNPSAQQARAAYATDPVYAKLTAALGEGTSGAAEPPATVTDGDEEVRLTWLIHDVQIWRIDHVYLTTDDGVWVKTVRDFSGDGRMVDRPADWHRAADAAGLLAALSTAGLLGDSGAASSNLPPADPPPNDNGPTESEAAVGALATSVPGMIAAGLAGLVLGAAGALVAVQARKRTPTERPARVTLSG